MVAFYKHDIPAWRGGTVMLSDRAYRVYHVIVEEIMLHEGPIPMHERSLAGKANRSTRDFKLAMNELIEANKIRVVGQMIYNDRSETELVSIRLNRENAAKGGRKVVEKSANTPREVDERSASGLPTVVEPLELSNENNGSLQASLDNLLSLKEKRREEKKEEASNDACPKRVRTQYTEQFLSFWSGYPTDANMSKKEASQVFARLSADERQQAIDSLPAFRAYCQAHVDYRPIHANRYLSKARYEGFNGLAKRAASSGFYIKRGTGQWDAWSGWYQKTKGGSPPEDKAGGWRFPSEWPPSHEHAA